MAAGEVSNPSLDSAFRDKQIQEINSKIEFASTADKILGLLAEEPIPVELTEEVTLYFYPPTDEQYIQIVSLQADGIQIAQKTKGFEHTPKTDEEALDMIPDAMDIINSAKNTLNSINIILATLSVDKSFTPEKFQQMPRKYKNIIIKAVSSAQEKEIKKTKKFR